MHDLDVFAPAALVGATVGEAVLLTTCTKVLDTASFTGVGVTTAVEVGNTDVANVEEETATERTMTEEGTTEVELGGEGATTDEG